MRTDYSKKIHVYYLCLIWLFGSFIYAQTLSYPFQFDDKVDITTSRIVSDLSNFVDLKKAQSYQRKPEYPTMVKRYVGYLSFALNYAVNGLDVRGYRIVNLCIHLINASLVYLFLIVLLETPAFRASPLAMKAPLGALLAGMLFAVHPLQSQAVTYVVQRLTSLATLFYLLSLVSYLKSRLSVDSKKARYGWFAVSLVAAVLGMKTKEIAFTLPLTAVLAEICFLKGSLRSRLRWLVPLGLTLLIIPFTHLALSGWKVTQAASISEVKMPRLFYLFTESRVLITYLRLWLFPVNQSVIYDYPVYESVISLSVIASAVILAILLGFGIYALYKGHKGSVALRVVAFGVFWFFFTLMVESTLVPLYPIFEHRMYLPSVGLSLLAAVSGMTLFVRLSGKKTKSGMMLLVVLIFTAMGCLTLNRNSVWRSEATFWQDTNHKAPGSLIAALNLANVYRSSRKYDDAIAVYQKSISLKPFKYHGFAKEDYHHAIAYDMIGDIYSERNDIGNAVIYYEKATQAKTSKWYISYAWDRLGTIQAQKGNLEQAVVYFKKAVVTKLQYKPCYNLGSVLLNLNRYEEAIHYLDKAIKLDPSQEDAYFNLAAAYFVSGRYENTVQVYQNLLSRNPRQFKAVLNLAKTYLALNDKKNAIRYLNRALDLNPRDLEANSLLEKAKRDG